MKRREEKMAPLAFPVFRVRAFFLIFRFDVGNLSQRLEVLIGLYVVNQHRVAILMAHRAPVYSRAAAGVGAGAENPDLHRETAELLLQKLKAPYQ